MTVTMDDMSAALDKLKASGHYGCDRVKCQIKSAHLAYIVTLSKAYWASEKVAAATLTDTKTDHARISFLSNKIDILALQRMLLVDDVLEPDRNEKLADIERDSREAMIEYTELRALTNIAELESDG